uniref:Uncharacterized protein n=1 Tax=Panagrellus redivivus TaxID=6233 RepID=A0A7E4ZYA0_PANRE
MILIAVIMCIIFRKKISNIIFAAECEPQNAPGSVFYSPRQFHHRGALQIKKVAPFDPKAQFADEKDNNPHNARFQFTEDQNEVFDIGSEVEQVIE